MWAFSQASASLDTVTPANDVIIRVGLSPSGSEQEVISSESQGGSSAQTCFLPEAQGDGFLLARVLSNPSQIALQRLSIRVQPSSSHALAKAPALPAVVCQFPAAVQPKCLRLVNDEQMDVVYLIVLTEQGVLYRLVLPAPLYCYSSLSDIETSATQHSVSYLQSRPSAQAITFEILDEDTLLLALNDGALLQLQQNRLDDHARGTSLCRHEGTCARSTAYRQIIDLGQSDAWQETALLAHSSWSIFQHHQDAKDTSVSIAAFYGQSDISDTGFTLSRDKTVKVWNLNRHKLIKSFDLAQLCSCFTASEHSISKEDVSSSKSTAGNTSLFHSMPLPYLRVVHADAINADYAAFLIIYAPQARAFLFFGIDVDDAGQVAQLVPVLQKPVDVSYASAELVDLRCEKVDRNALVGKQLDAEHSWTLWTLWAIGKQSHMTLMELPGLETMASSPSEELLKSNWVPILRPALPDVMQPVTEVTLDMLPPELQTDVTAIATLVGDRYLDHLFLPTRYSLPVLEAALQTYMETSNAVRPPTDAFMALRDIMPTVISSIVSLKTSASTGQSLVEEYKQDLEHEWMRLTALANELKLEAGFPLSLSVNTSKSGAHVMALERDSINTPTIQNQATLLRAQAASPSSEAFLSIPEEQLAESYPQLAPVSIREAVLTLCQSARHLVATVDSADNGRLSEELISLTCAMPVSTISEAAADIYDDVIAPSPAYVVQDREQALASIADLSQLPEAFDALLSVLMDPSLAQIPLEGPQPGLEEQAPSALCLSLVTAIAIDALESRFLLAQDIVSLLCMLRTEQPDLLENIDETINYYFAAYHRLFNLRSLSQSPSVPESANDIDATNDSLAAHLNALSVHVQAIHPTTSLEAFSLLNALFRNTPQSPEAICFAPCADLLALSTTLLSSTNQFSHSGSIEGGFDEASFAYRLFALGFAFEALSFCDTYPKCPLLDYVRGRALLEMDNLVDAKDAFELAAVDTGRSMSLLMVSLQRLTQDSDSIAQMLGRPSEPRVETLALYYGHIADLFFNHDAREEVFAFTSLAVSSGLEEETETIQREIWLRLFQSVNETSRFHDAYSTMIRVPYSDL